MCRSDFNRMAERLRAGSISCQPWGAAPSGIAEAQDATPVFDTAPWVMGMGTNCSSQEMGKHLRHSTSGVSSYSLFWCSRKPAWPCRPFRSLDSKGSVNFRCCSKHLFMWGVSQSLLPIAPSRRRFSMVNEMEMEHQPSQHCRSTGWKRRRWGGFSLCIRTSL